MRWGLGPVFVYDGLAASRRWQTYAVRTFGGALLLLAIFTVVSSRTRYDDASMSWREYAAIGESLFYGIIGVEITLVMLAAPAATAGAICVDRARGTLAHMLVTDLSDVEIVLGKLAARMLPVLGLVACSWPILAISSLLGGIDPMALVLAFAVLIAVALVGCSMALALSVWARKSHEVVMVVYTFWMAALLVWPIWYGFSWILPGSIMGPPDWTLRLDPYYVAFAPYNAPGKLTLGDYLGTFGSALGLSVLLVVLAVWRMRPVARKGIVGEGRPSKRAGRGLLARMVRILPGPSLDGAPVFWREWHRTRASRWLLVLGLLVGGSTTLACFYSAVVAWDLGLDSGPAGIRDRILPGVFGACILLTFGELMLAATAPTSMAEERQRGSLDLLTATPMSSATIVIGKWLGAIRPVLLLLIGPSVFALALATAYRPARVLPPGWPIALYGEFGLGMRLGLAGLAVATILIHGALIASVGLASAVWVARQGRAIAISIGFTLAIGGGWPILISTMRTGPDSRGLAALSPIVALAQILEWLSREIFYNRMPFGWILFWDVECLILALGLVWLTIRTFDDCLGRIPDRPVHRSTLGDILMVLSAMMGAGGVVGAVAAWRGAFRHLYNGGDMGIILVALGVAVGGVLASAMAARSTSREAEEVLDRRSYLARWWEAFRMVLLLAIGPVLIAVALVVAPVRVWIEMTLLQTPVGSSNTSWIFTEPSSGNVLVHTTDAMRASTYRLATAEEIARYDTNRPPARIDRLALAGLLVATILAHGAAIVQFGAAVGLVCRRRRRAAMMGAAIALVPIVIGPYLMGLGPIGIDLSTMAAVGRTLTVMSSGWTKAWINVEWIAYWDEILVAIGLVACVLALWALNRRAAQASEAGKTIGVEAAS